LADAEVVFGAFLGVVLVTFHTGGVHYLILTSILGLV